MREIGPNFGRERERACLRRVSVQRLELGGTAPTNQTEVGKGGTSRGMQGGPPTDRRPFHPISASSCCSAFIDKAGIACAPLPPMDTSTRSATSTIAKAMHVCYKACR